MIDVWCMYGVQMLVHVWCNMYEVCCAIDVWCIMYAV